MQVKIKYLHQSAKMPTYATDGSACFDLYAAWWNADDHTYSTGLAFEIPENYVMLVFSRSGDGFKRGISLANSVGVIDSDYRGEVKVKLRYDFDTKLPSHANGDRIAQALIMPIQQVSFQVTDTLTDTNRGTQGFGSTGA